MKSKTSLFNKTIFKTNITRFWPLWVLPSIIATIIAIASIYSAAAYERPLMSFQTRELFINLATDAVPTCMFIYACMVGLAVWNYMYSTRSLSIYHSAPVSRTTLFISNNLSALFMLFVPFFIAGIIAAAAFALLGAGDASSFFMYLGSVIFTALIFMGIYNLSAQICGNGITCLCVYNILNFLTVLIETIVGTFSEHIMFGYRHESGQLAKIFSPLIYMINNLCYTYDKPSYVIDVDGYSCLVYYAIAGIFLSAIALFMYTRRKSESAGNLIAFNAIKPVFYVVFTFIVSIPFGELIYIMFDRNSEIFKPVGIILCLLISGTITFFGAKMLIKKTLRVFKADAVPGILITFGLIITLCVCLFLDPFGVTSIVPETDKIESVRFVAPGVECSRELEDAESIEDIRALHKIILDNKASIINDTDKPYVPGDINSGNYYWININYELKNGKQIRRFYEIKPTLSDISDGNTFYSSIFDIVYDPRFALIELKSMEEASNSKPIDYFVLSNYSPFTISEDVDDFMGVLNEREIHPSFLYDEYINFIENTDTLVDKNSDYYFDPIRLEFVFSSTYTYDEYFNTSQQYIDVILPEKFIEYLMQNYNQ